MQAEIDFLRFANKVASGSVPELVKIDSTRRCVVLEDVKGVDYPPGIPAPSEDICAAVSFFGKLNSDIHLAQQMIHLNAREGFLRLSEHMSNTRTRLDKMHVKHLPAEFEKPATKALAGLRRKVESTEGILQRMLDDGLVPDFLEPELRCISPSDFGFHNAIRGPQGICFIDFEFAGWDDPGKAVIDFVYHPKNNVEIRVALDLANQIHAKNWETMTMRLKALGEVLETKWACIILSILQAPRFNDIILRTGSQIEELLEERLIGCWPYLEGLRSAELDSIISRL